jgi:hypothetical protein
VHGESDLQRECDAAYEMLMRLYGDRLSPEMADGLRAAVESVVKTVTALRATPLANGDAPLLAVAPPRIGE